MFFEDDASITRVHFLCDQWMSDYNSFKNHIENYYFQEKPSPYSNINIVNVNMQKVYKCPDANCDILCESSVKLIKHIRANIE
jgi:hypothetical protein